MAAEAERARSGSGCLVLLRGATGTGRTTLLEAVAEHAAARGMRVLRTRCSPEDTATPFAAVLQLLCSETEFENIDDAFTDPSDAHAGHATRLWGLLRSYAAEAPLLLNVDDVHLADGPSRRWLAKVARRIDRLPVLLVVTERSQYDIATPAPGLAHALSPALAHTHTLAPLSADATAELVRAACDDASCDDAVPADWVDACVRAGAGSPLLSHALLHDLRAAEPDGALPMTVPDTCAALYPGAYQAAVSWWLESAGPATTDVARALAVVDGHGPGDGQHPDHPDHPHHPDHLDDLAELLTEIAGADPARVPGWLTAMTHLGLLRPDPDGRPRYAHPLLRDAVLSGWSGSRRQAAHRMAAEVMLRRGDGAEAVAGQLLRAPAIGAPWAARVLLDAAAQAVREDRADHALTFLRRALDEPMPPAHRAAVLTELGSLEFTTVRSSAGIPRLAEAMRLSGKPQDRVRAAIALSTALAQRGDARAAIDVLRDLDRRLSSGNPDLILTVQSTAALLSDHDRGVRQEVYRGLREAAERSPRLVGPAGQALLVRYESTAGLISADAAMWRIRALLKEPFGPLEEPFLLGTAAAVAQWADELDEADRLVERGLLWQRPSLLHPMREALLNCRADIAAARGGYAQLLADPEVWQVTRTRRSRPDPSNAQAHAVVALVETGRIREARLLADSFSLHDSHDYWELNRFMYARGILRAACGDPAGALDDFLECGRRQSARDVVSPVVTPWRTAAAECRLALGEPLEALALAQEESRLAMVWNTPRLVGRSLRVLGTATGGRRGLELADRSVQLLRDAAVDTELIPALIAQGRQLTAAGERAKARDALREAAERAERLGAVRLRTLAGQGLSRGGARRSSAALTGAQALTGSERRIAVLAAEGRTNTEIAELLHLARRTVETHLTSTYRKLGIRRRGQLTGALHKVSSEPG